MSLDSTPTLVRANALFERHLRQAIAGAPFLTAYREGSFHYLLIAADRA
jgi:hypothetical protein